MKNIAVNFIFKLTRVDLDWQNEHIFISRWSVCDISAIKFCCCWDALNVRDGLYEFPRPDNILKGAQGSENLMTAA
jgi:hypothetical protein